MLLSTRFFLVALMLLVPQGFAAEPLTKPERWTFVPTAWVDGDSFQIRTKDGEDHTIRLYGADCVEWYVTDKTDMRRLREQRRSLGILETGGGSLGVAG